MENPYQALLDELDQRNPRLKALLQLMQQQQQAGAAGPSADEDQHSRRLGQLKQRYRAERKRGLKLKQLASFLQQENDFLRSINDTLSEALGSCPVCWGQDPACDDCEGAGQPGFRAPEPELFRRLIRPAVIRHGQAPDPGDTP